MDPQANLNEQLEISTRLLSSDVDEEETMRLAYRLAELVLALDEWIRKGGFLPDAWARRPYEQTPEDKAGAERNLQIVLADLKK